jgi:hypothetical protein
VIIAISEHSLGAAAFVGELGDADAVIEVDISLLGRRLLFEGGVLGSARGGHAPIRFERGGLVGLSAPHGGWGL